MTRTFHQDSMEWQLPVQKLEISNVNIGSPWARVRHNDQGRFSMKPMAPLSYFGTQFRLSFLSLLIPPLPVVEYNPVTGRLVLDMTETSLGSIKLNTFQETLQNAIMYHQSGWFKTDFDKSAIKAGFQPMINDNHLLLHCPLGFSEDRGVKGIPVYVDGAWKPLASVSITPGMRIRVAVKIHGISFLMNPDGSGTPVWGGRCRIQHRIQGILVQNQALGQGAAQGQAS